MPTKSLDTVQQGLGDGITREVRLAMGKLSKEWLNTCNSTTVSGETKGLQDCPTLRISVGPFYEAKLNLCI